LAADLVRRQVAVIALVEASRPSRRWYVFTLQGGAQSSARPDTVRDNRCRYEVHEGRMQTEHRTAHAGSRLKPPMIREGIAWKASLPAVLEKPVVRNDREDRRNVGIIRSPIRASHYQANPVRIAADF
jgi:hypothetical protein